MPLNLAACSKEIPLLAQIFTTEKIHHVVNIMSCTHDTKVHPIVLIGYEAIWHIQMTDIVRSRPIMHFIASIHRKSDF